MQAGIRAFIVDNAPAHQQESANAWASGLTGVGNLLGYLSGYLDLPKIVPFFGDTQFKVLCAIASISLSTTLVISCLYIKERDPRQDAPPPKRSLGVIGFFKRLFRSITSLPPQVTKVCEVQIAAWIGWFPFLYYSTTYVGQIYVNPIFEEHPDLSDAEINQVWAKATRRGTLALFINAVVSFSTNTILPLVVQPTYTHHNSDPVVMDGLSAENDADQEMEEDEEEEERRERRESLLGGEPSTSAPLLTNEEGEVLDLELKTSWILSKIRMRGFTLRRAWFLSYLLFAACMFSTFFVYSTRGATAVIALIGIPWALTLWAPFAFISAEIAKTNAQQRVQSENGVPPPPAVHDDDGVDGTENDVENGRTAKLVGEEEDDEGLVQAGIVLGLHNMAVSFPQILSSLISSAIFKAFQKPRGEPWDESVAWVLRFAGCAGLVAAWLTRRLSDVHA